MGEKRIIINLIVLLTFLFFFILFKFYNKKDGSTPPISPNILYLTSPVTSFSGKVEKIEGNTIFVSNQYDILQTIPVFTTFFPNKPSIIPTPKIKTLTYKVLITEKTQITQPPLNINYLFKTVSPTLPPKLTKKDIKVGQYIYINTQTDLRTLTGDVFEASFITLPPIINLLNGKIVNITDNVLTIKAFIPGAVNLYQEKKYRINITSNTEISRIGKEGKPEKLTLSDIKKDMQVSVYCLENVNSFQTLTAARIEPIK